jgi:hypothetical protein
MVAGLMMLTMGAVRAEDHDRPLVLAPAPEKLSVVRTSAELAGEPPILLGADEIHLGLEATKAAAGSAILVYCRMERVTARECHWKDDGVALGPLSLRVVPKGRKVVELRSERAVPVAGADGPVLFVAAAYLESPGNYELEISSPDGPVARADVQATASEGSVWSALSPGEKGEFVRARGTVIPHWTGQLARTLPEAGAGLPHFFPETPDADFAATAEGSRITIERWPAAVLDIPNQLLVRFWVNGKAVAPLPADRVAFTVPSGELPAAPKPVRFALGVTAADLGAKASDKIEMQLLFSPDGYDYAGMRLMHVLRGTPGAPPRARLSGRITLALSSTRPGG